MVRPDWDDPSAPIEVLIDAGADGSVEETLQLENTAVGVEAEDGQDMPVAYVLEQNFPNPFDPSTTIRYGLPEPGEVRLEVFDVLGRRVAVLVEGLRTAGRHEVVFEAGSLPSGLYVYRLQAGRFVAVRQMVVVR